MSIDFPSSVLYINFKSLSSPLDDISFPDSGSINVGNVYFSVSSSLDLVGVRPGTLRSINCFKYCSNKTTLLYSAKLKSLYNSCFASCTC